MPISTPIQVPGADALVRLFGQFSLADAELHAVRLTSGPRGVSVLEAELRLPGDLALPTGTAQRDATYAATLRCVDVAHLALADWDEHNVIAECTIEPVDGDDADGRRIHVQVTGSPGCDFDLRCRSVSVEVRGVA